MRQQIDYAKSDIDILENQDVEEHLKQEKLLLEEQILEKKIKALYASMDFNNGVLEDKYLIP